MNNSISKFLHIFFLIVHLYYCYMIFSIWGIRLKTFLFLTKINFFINLTLFIYLNLNTFLNFDKRQEISYINTSTNSIKENSNSEKKGKENDKEKEKNKENKLTHFQYTCNEMSLIRAGFSFSLTVNFLYWSILYFKPDYMGNSEIPTHVDLFLHGGNSIVILIEGYLNKKSLHENVRFGSLGVLLFAFGYISVKYIVYFYYDLQIYPMISKMNMSYYYCLAFVAYFWYLMSLFIFRKFVMEKKDYVKVKGCD
jgi:hypothetical protein